MKFLLILMMTVTNKSPIFILILSMLLVLPISAQEAEVSIAEALASWFPLSFDGQFTKAQALLERALEANPSPDEKAQLWMAQARISFESSEDPSHIQAKSLMEKTLQIAGVGSETWNDLLFFSSWIAFHRHDKATTMPMLREFIRKTTNPSKQYQLQVFLLDALCQIGAYTEVKALAQSLKAKSSSTLYLRIITVRQILAAFNQKQPREALTLLNNFEETSIDRAGLQAMALWLIGDKKTAQEIWLSSRDNTPWRYWWTKLNTATKKDLEALIRTLPESTPLRSSQN